MSKSLFASYYKRNFDAKGYLSSPTGWYGCFLIVAHFLIALRPSVYLFVAAADLNRLLLRDLRLDKTHSALSTVLDSIDFGIELFLSDTFVWLQT